MEKREFLKATTFGLSESVEYSDNAVVSKTVLNKSTGTVTLFAFDKGQGLSEHKAPFDAMVQVIDGEAVIYINKEPHSVKNGEFIIMPANISHALDAKERFKMMLIMIKSAE